MPELPEVETIVRTLRPGLVGARVDEVWTSGLPLRLARPVDRRALARHAQGARVLAVRRRAKYVLIDVARPDTMGAGKQGASGVWLVHLGMSGRLRLQDAGEPRPLHTHVVWTLDGGRELRFSDPRRFGLVKAAASEARLTELAQLGPDPLTELNAAYLAAELGRSRAPLKSFLLDQKRVAGLGNIYVCEALFVARLHPAMPAHRARNHAEALLAAIQRVLNEALLHRGTTLRDFIDSEGHSGSHQDMLFVYGRQGDPCRHCGAAIVRRVDGGRSTFFCSQCQPRTLPQSGRAPAPATAAGRWNRASCYSAATKTQVAGSPRFSSRAQSRRM